MQVKLFNTRMDADQLPRDQQALNSFMETVTVKQTAAQFVNGSPDFWSILVFYEQGEIPLKENRTKDKIPAEEKNSMEAKPAVEEKIKVEEKIPEPVAEELQEEEQQILLALKTWRKDKANELQQPEFMIFPNATALSLAKEKPRTTESLTKIKGLGPAKITKYGDDLMAILNAF